ncbi:hypothetical protein OF83DRAFT_1084788 [Amylostereum chailletii]|nr:hypothetical protein OF83DRAFT_1084788 [Amylostereum chailletii]
MSFPLTRPSSPSHSPSEDPHPHRSLPEVDVLASALHNALQGITGGGPSSSSSSSAHPGPSALAPPSSRQPDPDMANLKDKDKHPSLEIVVASDVLTLRGTGVDVTPTSLQGHLVLNLVESTSLKEITLQFRGKARLPAPSTDMSINSSAMTYLVCNHEWSFLEGDKKHTRTLKAGRHLFPFQLRIGGSLPSSISTPAFGGASVQYKLRATATRPGLAHNLQTQVPISINRSFAAEALEYQQTLEIENTWPEKLMYSIMIPHKAWAAGDTVTAVVKFSPLTKGARVLSVGTVVNETVKLYVRTGWQETTKVIASTKHGIHNGRAVKIEQPPPRSRAATSSASRSLLPTPGPRSMPATPGVDFHHASHVNSVQGTPASTQPPAASTQASYFSSVPGMVPGHHEPPVASSSLVTLPDSHDPHHAVPTDFELSDQDVVTTLDVFLPPASTPTHSLEPIIISHRIRWSILISNLDGHTSELRCSLPMHVLDHSLIDEAKSATAATRRLLLGGPEVAEEADEEMELPSYSSHVRDRVANMFLPEQGVLRVTNPWVQNGISPVQMPEGQSAPVSGLATPLEAHHIHSYLGHAHGNLEYVNSELLLSLTSDAPPALEPSQPGHQSPHNPTPPDTASPSQGASRRQSRANSRSGSRAGSRAPSPEPHSHRSSGSNSPDPSLTYVHDHSSASRNHHGLFHISMKPFTSISSPFFRHNHHHHTSSHSTPATPRTPPAPVQIIRTPHNTSQSLLHRAFTEVPDYGIASRGFLGGVTPLESMQGLPSYEEAETQRSFSDTDLAARFASAAARTNVRGDTESETHSDPLSHDGSSSTSSVQTS